MTLDIAHAKRLVASHVPQDADDAGFKAEFLHFFDNIDAITGRSPHGILTAAAWVVDPALQKVLLLRNDFLSLWLNPGGKYNEGDLLPEFTMGRELREEAGIAIADPLLAPLIDLDVIPPSYNPRLKVPFYDMRFLVIADSTAPLHPHEEDKQPAWYTYEEARAQLTDDVRNWRLLRRTRDIFCL